MPRIRAGASRHQKKKRILRQAKGFHGKRKNAWRIAKQSVLRAAQMRRAGLRMKKRDFRRLWVTRLSAACQVRGIRYSEFIHGLVLANVDLNRKVLSELAIHDPAAFDAVVAKAKAAVAA